MSSLAGDGVAIALTSGTAAADALLRGGPEASHDYQARFARAARRPLGIANALRHLGENGRTRPMLMRAAAVPGLAGLAARLTRIA